jgi:hypothetical protein
VDGNGWHGPWSVIMLSHSLMFLDGGRLLFETTDWLLSCSPFFEFSAVGSLRTSKAGWTRSVFAWLAKGGGRWRLAWTPRSWARFHRG